jgi:heme-degrading monooxygenase HmoA
MRSRRRLIERFQSLSEPGKILSLSCWRDEAAIAQWRRFEQHRAAQRAPPPIVWIHNPDDHADQGRW